MRLYKSGLHWWNDILTAFEARVVSSWQRKLQTGRRFALGALHALDQLPDLDGVLRLPARQQRRLVHDVRELGTGEPCASAMKALRTCAGTNRHGCFCALYDHLIWAQTHLHNMKK